MKEVYNNIVRSLRDGSSSLKVVQKLLINSVGERDFSAQETCHHLLQLPLVKSTRDFTILSLDGSRQVEEQPEEGTRATVPSILDHYLQRPSNPKFEGMSLLHFAQHYSMPKEVASNLKHQKMKVAITRPYSSPDPNGPKYEQYCKQKLMLHIPFHQLDQLKGSCRSFSEAYTIFLQSGNVPPCLKEDIERLNVHQGENDGDDEHQVHVFVCVHVLIIF